jgi:hypothetical protein
MRRSSLLLAVVALLLISTGCGSSHVTVRVDSTPETNEGRPFYMVVRSVESAAFVTEGYDSVASKVFATPKDQTVLASAVIFPGIEQSVEVEKPQALPLAVYFLFSKPGERWKTTRTLPVPTSVDIELAGNEIKREE